MTEDVPHCAQCGGRVRIEWRRYDGDPAQVPIRVCTNRDCITNSAERTITDVP